MSKECLGTSPMKANSVFYDAVKRLFDILAGTVLLVIASPVLLWIALRIRCSSPGSVLYRQVRVGRHGRLFHVYKFRTMYADADRCGPLITSSDDPRVTPLRRFLRSSKLDELPQLINVVKGDMSLVGPRPQVPRFVEHFRSDHQAIILAVRPGITGPTQLEFRYEEDMLKGTEDREAYYIAKLLPTKCRMDVDYVQRRSLLYDLKVLTETIALFLRSLGRRVLRPQPEPVFEVVVNTNYHDLEPRLEERVEGELVSMENSRP